MGGAGLVGGATAKLLQEGTKHSGALSEPILFVSSQKEVGGAGESYIGILSLMSLKQ